MIFTMDVGNTNIKTALFEGREMRNYWRISTNTSYTSDEYGLILEGLFARAGRGARLRRDADPLRGAELRRAKGDSHSRLWL